MAVKICRTCGKSKDFDADFSGNKNTPDKKQPDCRKCIGAKITAARLANKKANEFFHNANTKPARVSAKAKPTQPTATASVATPVAIPVAAPVSSNAPVFVSLGDVDVALSSVALVDKTLSNGSIEVVLNVHEVNPQGYVVAKVFQLSGAERDTFLGSYSVATGKPITDTREIERLKAENAALKRDNETALQLAQEAQARVNALKAALN